MDSLSIGNTGVLSTQNQHIAKWTESTLDVYRSGRKAKLKVIGQQCLTYG